MMDGNFSEQGISSSEFLKLKAENLAIKEAILDEREALIREAADIKGKRISKDIEKLRRLEEAGPLMRTLLNPFLISGAVITAIIGAVVAYNLWPEPSAVFKAQKASVEHRLSLHAGEADTPFSKCSYQANSDAFSYTVEGMARSFNSAGKLPPAVHDAFRNSFERARANAMKACEGKAGEIEYNLQRRQNVENSMRGLVEYLRVK